MVNLSNGTILSIWKDDNFWFGEIDFQTSIVSLGPMATEEEAKYQTMWLSGSKKDFTKLNWESGKRIIVN